MDPDVNRRNQGPTNSLRVALKQRSGGREGGRERGREGRKEDKWMNSELIT